MIPITQVPAGDSKKDLLDHLDKVPTYVQTLQFTVKEPTVGKAATFLKVDHVIKETKNLMNVINKVVTTCFDCANKVSIFVSQLIHLQENHSTLHYTAIVQVIRFGSFILKSISVLLHFLLHLLNHKSYCILFGVQFLQHRCDTHSILHNEKFSE